MAEGAAAGAASTVRLTGAVVVRELEAVSRNPWNPNVMTPEERASLRHGFETDGWIVSQALLVWGTDETGARRDVIIDGEQKWTVARDVGLTHGPMVFLDGKTEAEAKKLTIKMNQKRGHWDPTRLEDLLQDLEAQGEALDAVDLGFGEDQLAQLLAAQGEAEVPDVAEGTSPPTTGPRAPDAPREVTEADVQNDLGSKRVHLVVACADVDVARAVAEVLRANKWEFTEELR